MIPYELHRGFVEPSQDMTQAFSRLPYRPAPVFLGNFDYVPYRSLTRLPNALRDLAFELAYALAPDQPFNAAFIQSYRAGTRVRPHRDPINNTGHTIIAVFGGFTGGESNVAGDCFTMGPGDVLKLACTIDGIQGPLHSVSKIESGCRYALILNTIE